MKCRQTFTWTEFNGTERSVWTDWKATIEEAFAASLEAARSMGWTPPKCWQWWRWRDQPRSELFRKD